MTEAHFILATAGHVDHGKSALIKALTGTDPDRLPEEKARGITIDLGFAHLSLPALPTTLNSQLSTFSIGIVDVPGHEDFVKNMVAGVGAIDLALLVVAADDGWMPQTEEHLQILNYLGVSRAVIALTKSDLVESPAEVITAIRSQLRDSDFAEAPIVPTSVISKLGLEELKAVLAHEFSRLTPSPDIGKPRLAIDRSFSLRGVGTVVTGTVSGGIFARGGDVAVQPNGQKARIRALQNHHHEVDQVLPGMRAALSLPELPVSQRAGDGGLARGDIVTQPGLGEASAAIDVVLHRSSRLPLTTRPLKHGGVVRIHHGSGAVFARVLFIDAGSLKPGQSIIAQLRFEHGVFVFAGDRFVVRDSAEKQTLAGGIVLDPNARSDRFRSQAQRELLQKRAAAPDDAAMFVSTELARDHHVARESLLAQSRFAREQIGSACTRLTNDSQLLARGNFLLESGWWRTLKSRAGQLIDREHREQPNHPGLKIAQLRSELGGEMQVPEIFDELISELCREGFARQDDAIKRTTHRPELPPALQRAGASIRAALSAKPFDPPSSKELAPDSLSQQALRFFRDTGEIVELNAETVLARAGFEKMRETVVAAIKQNGPSSTGELRKSLGSSRRVVIPFLERLDRDGVTQRAGDKRMLVG